MVSVGSRGDVPALVVDDAVVVSAEQDEFVQSRGPSVGCGAPVSGCTGFGGAEFDVRQLGRQRAPRQAARAETGDQSGRRVESALVEKLKGSLDHVDHSTKKRFGLNCAGLHSHHWLLIVYTK